ncbi:DUF550 domain-containing protein [Klebsiella pneumoniae]|uniref:DUF550 domain-containing protein n=1 Tax=Klebsiella pneumoniae TaxID=573 RepID=UPI000B4179CB|nr:DUF550 domain-containing protein [Klebsiella pneumoniae]HDS2294023.1 DUF550 domain-containing protein [Klebsiella pneumoniae subsp. pneumoniae]EKU2220257.1 DUF550 domain-containing protein [Klebsiella pneumoniae]EKU2239768.1 DUF550 domain-containing protein [Klebsiella pneumoniae]EKV3272308.1 DUF550 domain-containing protein [Klebsiella pneumoniae]
MTDIATFTNEQLIAVCRADVAEMSKFLKEGEFSNPSRAAMYLRITEIALAALMGEFSFARNQVRREHAEWSQATFGNVGPVGPLNHLSKEALEAATEPGDLSEWADMQFLLWDAQRRAGITDEQITQAMIEKLAVNKQRSWPEPKDGEPRLHIHEQPALTGNFPIIGIDLASGPDRTVEVSYVASPGYVMVPMRLTAENGAKGALSGEFSETKFVNCPECFGDDECETCDGSGRIEITVPVTWTTIKEIWAKGVEHFAAALQEVK